MAVKYFFPSLNITLTERQFEEMKKLCKIVPALPGRVFEKRARRIARLTRARAYAVCREIREGNYVRIITWYKVLAVLTLIGTTNINPKERHLEARMLIDCPDYVYGTREFEEFCMWCLERFYEINGYAVEMIEASVEEELAFFGIEKIDEFEDREDREVEVLIEIYDYNYSRVPFEATIVLPPYYWRNWVEAKKEFERQARNAVYGGRQSKLEEYMDIFGDTISRAERGESADKIKRIKEFIEEERERRKIEYKLRRKEIEEERKEMYRRGEHFRR